VNAATNSLYGVLAEFEKPDEIVDAARRARDEGYRRLEAYTPFAVEGLDDALRLPPSRLALITLLGGVAGGVGGYLLQYWAMVLSYPINSGGRPLNSWPAYIPVTFELTILGAALAVVIGLFGLNGLPRPHHPLFNVPEFDTASRSRFFLCIEARDPKFESMATRTFLETLSPKGIYDVES
jgi:hypothetical protein